MFCFKKLRNYTAVLNHISRNVRIYFHDKTFDVFRSNADYKNLVVPIDKTLNKYAAPVNPELKSIEADVFFYNLMQREHVMKLTSSQVKDILGLMASQNVDAYKYDLPLKHLDEKCALSAERWPLDLSFYVLDTWCIILGYKAFHKHFYSAILSQWSKRIKRCTKSNLILILYFVGLSKSSQPFLMDAVIDRMESIISDFSDEEIALACLSFFKCSKDIDSPVFLKRACESATNLLKKHDRFNSISILKCLRLSKYFDEQLWEFVKNYAVRESITFNVVECTNFLALFASQSVYNKELFDSLEAQTTSALLKELESGANEKDFKTHPNLRSRPKDFARFLWTLTTVGHPIKEETLKCLTDCIGKRLHLGEYESQMHVLIDTLQSFVLANYYTKNIFSSSLNSSTYKRIYESDRAKPKYQLYFIEKSLAIEHPEIPVYKRNVINPIPRQLKKDIEARKGFKEITSVIHQHFLNSYKVCYLIPHIMIAGIFLTQPSTSTDGCNIYHRLISDGVINKQVQPLLRNGRKFLCIEILDPTVCVSQDKQPTGLMQTKIRQLKKLNFEVITLCSDEIDNIIENNCNINELILSKLS